MVSNGYQMSFTSLADSTNAIALIGSNSQFIWNGGAKLFALRPFTLNATGTGNLINNGTGALTILQPLAITGTSGARTLALQGSNTGTNRFAGNITDGPGSVVSLNVSGTAVWGLSGTNTYSGATTIGNGNPNSTLVIQGLQALSPNTTIAMTANSTPASTLKLLDDGTGVLTLSNTLTTSFGNTTLNNLIVVGNNNTANGGISAGTTSGTTIALRKLSLGANAGVGTQGFKEIQGFNNYKLQFNSVDLPGFLNGNATWKAQFNPTTAAVILAGTIQQLAGNTTAGPVTLELAGTNIANLAIGNIKDAVDYPGSATAVALMVTKTSSSTWTLSGTNTFSGGLTLSGASVGSQLNINSATALGTGTFTISGGNNARFDNTSGADITLTTNAQTWNNDFVFVGSTNLNLGNGAVTMGGTRGVTVSANTLTVGGLGGAAGAGLTKAGNGALVLNGTNTYTGATTVNFGALLVNGDASAATNNVRVGVFGTFGGTGIVGGVTTFTNNSGKLLLTLTPTAATAYSNSTYLTFTNAVFLTNVTVTVNMPTNLGNGVYVLATNYVTPVTGGSLNFVTNSGALAAGGSGVVSRSGNNLVLTVSGVFANFITTNTVTTSASPVPYSTAVTFTSTVQTNAPLGAATAAGSNVVFSVDGTPVATNALSSGVATYVNNTLTNGTHTITAAYLGDGLYLPSTNIVSQVITKLTPILKTAPVASAITAGQGLSNSVVTLGVFTNLWGTGNVVVMSSTNFLTPGLVPNVGTTNVQVYFVPSDLSNYNYVTNVVAVLVKAPGSFSGISVTGTALTLTVTNGIPNGAWTLLESTNLLLPIAQWPTNRTGTYDGSGNLTTNIANLATNPAAFYLLK